MHRKGFPESYDTRRLLSFLRELKSGVAEVDAPVYSHVVYDIVDGGRVTVHQPEILILEGLNVLQVGDGGKEFVSDYFDFSIFIDAAEEHIEQWYVERFLKLRESVFQHPESFFKHFAHLTDEQATETPRSIWTSINGVNLRETASRPGNGPRRSCTSRLIIACARSSCASSDLFPPVWLLSFRLPAASIRGGRPGMRAR